MCRITILQRLKGNMSLDAHDFNNIETRDITFLPPPAKQGPKENSRNSERNIRGTCKIVCHRKKLVDPVQKS